MGDFSYWNNAFVNDINAIQRLLDLSERTSHPRPLLDDARLKLRSAQQTKRSFKLECHLIANPTQRNRYETQLAEWEGTLQTLSNHPQFLTSCNNDDGRDDGDMSTQERRWGTPTKVNVSQETKRRLYIQQVVEPIISYDDEEQQYNDRPPVIVFQKEESRGRSTSKPIPREYNDEKRSASNTSRASTSTTTTATSTNSSRIGGLSSSMKEISNSVKNNMLEHRIITPKFRFKKLDKIARSFRNKMRTVKEKARRGDF